jgi:hypothetical protein
MNGFVGIGRRTEFFNQFLIQTDNFEEACKREETTKQSD